MAPRCTRTRRSTRISTTTRSLARSWPRPTWSTVPRTSASATGAATSCRPSWPRRRGGAAGCARPSADSRSGPPPKRSRSRRRVPSGCGRESAAWRRTTRCDCRANEAYEAYRTRGVMKDGRRFGKPPTPYKPSATPQGSTSPIPTRNVKSMRPLSVGTTRRATRRSLPCGISPCEAQARSAWIASTRRGEGADGVGEDTRRSSSRASMNDRCRRLSRSRRTASRVATTTSQPRMLGRRSGSSARPVSHGSAPPCS